jgi:UDP-glucose:(heptosyl)LPS alpha-1,3-glucosyltransferase
MSALLIALAMHGEYKMKLAFCLFTYFPFGGLQRDFDRIARACLSRGNSIHVFTMSWEGEVPSGFDVSLIPARGMTNHRRCWNFSRKLAVLFERERFDLVVGFNKMQGLDVYYAADPCYKAKVNEEKNSLHRLGPRYRTYLTLEKAVFDPSSRAEILLISEQEKAKYITYYKTPEDRFHSLPPGISRDRVITGDVEAVRQNTRNELGVAGDELLLLMVGSGFKTKGLDRSLLALASLPETLIGKTRLFVIGKGKAQPFERIAKGLNIAERVFFLGCRDDVPRFMAGADLLLHPAYSENTGTVLIEAMAAGLPVLATDICGYASHVSKAGAGLLIPSPFDQQVFNELLSQMMTSPEREIWKRNGIDYVAGNDFLNTHEKAADILESVARNRHHHDGTQ